MPNLQGGCICGQCRYILHLSSPDDARTTLCHCNSCKRAFGGNYGLTAKCSINAFEMTAGSPKLFVQEDTRVHREFCGNCGSYLCEYGERAKDRFRYVVVGSLDDGPEALPPKGEFFCKFRAEWMPRISGTFQKQEIKE